MTFTVTVTFTYSKNLSKITIVFKNLKESPTISLRRGSIFYIIIMGLRGPGLTDLKYFFSCEAADNNLFIWFKRY